MNIKAAVKRYLPIAFMSAVPAHRAMAAGGLACFFATRMPEKGMEARIQSVIDRVRPTVPSLSSLMQPKPEAPLVFKVEKPEQSLIF